MKVTDKVRKIIAKIQREIDFPKVTALRCVIQVPVRDGPLTLPLEVKTLDPPPVVIRDGNPRFEVQLRDAAITQPDCHAVQPLYDISTEVRDVPCWEDNGVVVHHPRVALRQVAVNDQVISRISVKLRQVPVRFPRQNIRSRPLIKVNPALRDLPFARQFPIMLPVHPMSTLSKKFQIRYRAGTLKLLGLAAKDILFVGVCFGVPPAKVIPMGFNKIGKVFYAFGQVDSEPNPVLGLRVWVIVQQKGNLDYLRVALKQE